jgi:hypothetical protein
MPPGGTAADPPPSAEDFWGERAASIHDALQAPADQWPPAGAAPGGDRAAGNRRDGATRTGRPRVRYRGRRRRSLAIAACVTLTVLAALAVALNPLGADKARRGGAGGSKIPLASILSNGLSHALAHDVPHIGSAGATTHARVRSARATRRHAAHTRSISHPVRGATPARSGHAVSSQPASAEYTARETPAAPATNNTSASTPAAASSSSSRSASTSAPVSATGASGALGPIQSPNG